jgi:hypothetical protein
VRFKLKMLHIFHQVLLNLCGSRIRRNVVRVWKVCEATSFFRYVDDGCFHDGGLFSGRVLPQSADVGVAVEACGMETFFAEVL